MSSSMPMAQILANLAGLSGSLFLVCESIIVLRLRYEIKKTRNQAAQSSHGGEDFLRGIATTVENMIDHYRPWHAYNLIIGTGLLALSDALPLIYEWFLRK